MTVGKNKLMRFCRMYVNGGDLSGDSRAFTSAESALEEVDMTGWLNSQIRSYIADPALLVSIRGYQAMMNDATNQSYDLLKNAGVTGMEVSMVFGGGGAPTAGDPVYLLGASSFSSRVTIDERKAILTADFLPDPTVVTHYKPFGVVLLPLTAVAGGVTGVTIDNLAATTGGYHAHLHIIVSGGTFSFALRHGTNGIAWATLATFTANGGTITSERLSGSGTVDRYRRIEVTQSVTGLCQAVCVFATQ